MRDSQEFFVHKERIIAFAEVLEAYELKNEIGYATGNGISITVWYDNDDENYTEYIGKLAALDDD